MKLKTLPVRGLVSRRLHGNLHPASVTVHNWEKLIVIARLIPTLGQCIKEIIQEMEQVRTSEVAGMSNKREVPVKCQHELVVI